MGCRVIQITGINKKRKKYNRKKNSAMKIKEAEATMCYYCGRVFVQYGLRKVVEHFVPLHAGGSNNNLNKTVACHECDELKEDKIPFDFCNRIKSYLKTNHLHGYTRRQLERILYAVEMFDICN